MKYRMQTLGNQIYITGFPEEDDETHNCNIMGYSSTEHILYKGVFEYQICGCRLKEVTE